MGNIHACTTRQNEGSWFLGLCLDFYFASVRLFSSSSPQLLSLSLCPFLHLLKSSFAGCKKQQQKQKHVSSVELTGSPLTVHLTETCWCFWETTFPSSSLRGKKRGWGHLFPLTHSTNTQVGLRGDSRPHQHANIFTDSQTTAGSMWQRAGVGFDMKPDSRGKKQLPGAAQQLCIRVHQYS